MTRVAITLEQCWHRVPGGTAVSALESVAALAAHPDIDMVGVSARHRRPAPEPWRPPIPVCALPLPRIALYEAWHRLRRPLAERATGPVDVVHATSPAIPASRAPLLVTVHDLAYLHHPEHATRQSFFTRSLELTRRHADLVMCPSQASADDCAANGIAEDRIRVVPWGVGGPRAADEAVAGVRYRHGLPDRYVLWVGTEEPRKNVRRLVQAFERLGPSGVALVLVGPTGWGESVDDLLGRVEVHRLGFLPEAALRSLYRGASVFCYPSLSEGFGLPVLEAMYQGTPVVTSSDTATAEVAGDTGLLVDPESVDQIADALGHLLGDEGAAAELGRRGAERAASYSWDRTAALIADLYRELGR
jgi:glycosyltransferase involved in cell wall biosynthesis